MVLLAPTLPADTGVALAAVLIIALVVMKVATANLIDRAKAELSLLDKARREVAGRLESALEQKKSQDATLAFHERRKDDITAYMAELAKELATLEEAWQKHQETLSYYEEGEAAPSSEDPSATEGDGGAGEEAAPGSEQPVTSPGPEAPEDQTPRPPDAAAEGGEPSDEPVPAYRRPGADIDPSVPLVVLPASMGNPENLLLPDAITTELLAAGLNVVERTTLFQQARDQQLDPVEILAREEYHRLGEVASIGTVVVINSTVAGGGVAQATCKAIDIATGTIVASTSYDQQEAGGSVPQSLTQTARSLAATIREAVRQ